MSKKIKNNITVERTYKPVPILMHASYCLRNIRAAEGRGSYYADVGALVLLAIVREEFFYPTDGLGNWGQSPLKKSALQL